MTGMATVKIRTSDTAWIASHGLSPAVSDGEDCNGVKFFSTTVRREVQRVTFAGAQMARFDLGTSTPKDQGRHVMVPAAYVVSEG
jgi:hypothetical protein